MQAQMQQMQQRLNELEEKLSTLQANAPHDQISMVVFSGDLDRMLAAFIIATGAAAMFERVVMFFTFWATPALKDAHRKVKKADVMAKMFAWMLPKGAGQLKLSKMNMAGAGTRMMKDLMEKKGVMSLEKLMKTAADFGVEIVVCEMSMDLMGISREEIIDYPNISIAGVASFLQEAGRSKATLFI
jgi:peroxiredoxin family protein